MTGVDPWRFGPPVLTGLVCQGSLLLSFLSSLLLVTGAKKKSVSTPEVREKDGDVRGYPVLTDLEGDEGLKGLGGTLPRTTSGTSLGRDDN